MERNFNKKQFDTIIKGTYVFLRWSIKALFVLGGLLAVGLVTIMFLPKSLLNYDLANIEHVNVQVMNVLYEIDSSLFQGIINVKWLLVVMLLVLIANLGFFQYLLIFIKNIIRDVKEGSPFAVKNVERLKYMGYGFMVAALVLPAVNSSFFVYLFNKIQLFNANVNFSINLQYVFMGVIILILAKIFDYGAYLQEDHDMTV